MPKTKQRKSKKNKEKQSKAKLSQTKKSKLKLKQHPTPLKKITRELYTARVSMAYPLTNPSEPESKSTSFPAQHNPHVGTELSKCDSQTAIS